MIPIIYFILTILLSVLAWYKWPDKEDAKGSAVFLFFLLTILGIIFCSSLCGIPSSKPYNPYIVNIVQLKTSQSSDLHGGGSFLGWSINGENKQQYVIMEKSEDGRMIRRFLDQDCTYVIEENTTPRVEYRQEEWYWPKWYAWPWLWDNIEYRHYYDSATIYVPVGTVVVKFEEL